MNHAARILLDAAERWPDQTLSTDGGDGDGASVTFAGLVGLARRFAGGLDAAGVTPGEPVALLVDDLLDFAAAWWGSLFAGAIPAPMAAPRAHAPGDMARVALATGQLGGRAIVDRGRASEDALTEALDVGALDVGALLEAGALAALRRGPLAMVQFSSGSTRAPRGVAISHENLVTNVEQMLARLPLEPGDVKLTWMPHYHDMGLIGCHLLTTRAGVRQVRMHPLVAMRDPLTWAKVAARHGATVLSTTNFALSRLNDRLASGGAPDLSRVRLVFNGAEPISPAVCARFCALTGLPESVHLPLYGLAEATVGVTAPSRGGVRTATIGGRVVVGVGEALPGLTLAVLDGEGEALPEGEEGAVHIHGPNVSEGYWGEAARPGDPRWLDTGDLGALVGGELFLTGRAKDVIVVNGRNLHAHDVEAAAEAARGVKAGGVVAFADRRGEVEGLALGVTTERGADTAPALWAARRAVEGATGASPSAVIPLPRIPRTTSGKKRRAQVRAALEAGALDAAAGNTLAALRVTWEAALGRSLSDEELGRPLGELGGDSVMLAESLAALSARFGATLDHRLLARAGTLAALARLVEREPPASSMAIAGVGGSVSEEPVAVVAATCRMPGADSPEAFWALIASGESRIEEGRFGQGAWLAAPDRFDAARFGIGAAEAAAMDPQQRLVLELADEALERAGAVGESSVGVYIGAGQQAYMEEVLAQLADGAVDALPPGTLAGNLLALLASRVSHQLDLRGPALTVDTACSSSLVAVHLACQALRRGECALALAGGVNLNLSPAVPRLLDRAGVLSPSGRCRPFHADADGTLPGEGAGVLLLQPLSAALAQGRPVLGVIRGTAINNDGRSLGVMAPNPAGQEAVIRRALASASVPASAVRFVEAHGSGTRLGDSVEAAVLSRCYPHDPPRGAVKGQVGHLLAAAGIAGLLRALGELGVDEAGAVSSFGFGGTNAHAVLTGPTAGAPEMGPPRPVAGERYWLGRAQAVQPAGTGTAAGTGTDLAGWVHTVRADAGGGLVWSPCPEGDSPLVEGGRYLITGGTGGLGQILARYLAGRYRARLTLLSRSASRARFEALAAEVEAAGGAVAFEAMDLADAGAATRLRGRQFDGVFHLAGTTGAGAARAKREGLKNLEGVEAGFMALYSSIAGVLPGLDRGLEDYAQANAWLDAYAAAARAAGRAVVSVSWGPWAGEGMAGAHAEAFRARGVTPIEGPRAMAALERALGSGEAHVVVLDRGRSQASAAPLPEDLEGRVVALIARAADLDPEEVDRESTLTELGVDSLEALELVKELEVVVGRGLPTTLLYEHDTLPALLAALRGGATREEAREETSEHTLPEGAAPVTALLPSQQTFVVQQAFFPEMPGNVFMGVTVSTPDGAPLERRRLEAALATICARHPALGSVIRREDGALREVEGARFPALAWGAIDEGAVAAKTFDLALGPLCRVHCDGRRLVMNAHHSVIDAWSLKNALEELLATYAGAALPPIASTWRQAAAMLAATTDDEAALAWWRERYAGGVPPLNLPWRAPVDAPTAGGCGVDRRVLEPSLSEALAARAREAGVSLPALVLALYMRALYDASGQQSVTVRVAQARRELRLPDVGRLVGSFADSLPITARVRSEQPLLALARQVHETLGAARANGQASSMALAGLAQQQAAGPVGLTPAGFSFPLMREQPLPGGLTLDDVHGRAGAGFTRLTLVAWRLGGRVHAAFNYARSHLDAETVEAVADDFLALARSVALGEDGAHTRPPAQLHLRVLDRCRRHPERVAVAGVSYGQLDRRSGALAAALSPLAGPGERVAVLANPGPEAVVALLAALRTGAAFVPLDPSWPDARVAQVLAAADPCAVLAPPSLRERAEALAGARPVFTVGTAEGEGPEVAASEEALAWVMFTSGSTGQPKGVVVSHRAALAFLDWVSRVFGVTEADRFVQTASLGYGGAIRQIFSPLLAGGTIHPVPPAVKRDPDALVAFMHAEGVTIWNSVPSMWGHLMDAAERSPLPAPFAAVRWVLVGGEAVPGDMVRRWRSRFPGRVVNLYGSTETIVNATFFEVVRPPEGLHTPIGWARGAVDVHLLDEVDGVGEIAVGGAIASGYWRAPEAEAAAFVDHPTLGRLYRTGDLGRRAPDGALVFAGRADSQVQVHGNRVELLEVEHALASHPGVDAALVVFSDRRLTAFVEIGAGREAGGADAASLRAWMSGRLPEYMVPHRFRLEPVPRNAAGKADRRSAAALLSARADPSARATSARDVADRAGGEAADGTAAVVALVAAAWREVLDLEHAPTGDDDFFALGGDSIRALEVLDRLRGRVAGTLRPLALYRHRRLGELAAALAALAPEPSPGQAAGPAGPALSVDDSEYPLSTVQRGFWTAHRAAGSAPVWCAEVPLDGPVDPRALQRALDLVVSRHDVLRSRFRSGRRGPVQRTGPAEPIPLRFDDLTRLPERVRAGALAQRWAEAAAEDFPLDGWPLFSARLIRESDARHRLLLASHHIVSDAWSCWVMAGELLTAHDAYAAGRAPSLPDVRASLRAHVRGESTGIDPWWTRALRGLTQAPATREEVGAEERQRVIQLTPRGWQRLKSRARALRVSPFVLVLRALVDAIGEARGAGDLVIATAISGREGVDREQVGLAGLVAPLARGLPVRLRPGASVEAARDAFAEACDHADASPVSMVAALGAQAMAILGRYFLTWLDPSAVPAPPTGCALDWSGARFRFATGATNTELFASALVGDDLRLTLRGGPLVARVAPLLERALTPRRQADAALVVYAPDDVPLPIRTPMVVEQVDVGEYATELVLLPWTASEVASRPGLEAAVAEAMRATDARVVALAGVLPARTGLAARALGGPGVTLTTGHSVTVTAMLLTVQRALAETGRDWRALTVGVLGYGAIGQAVLRLCVAALGEPAAVWIEDPSRSDSRCVAGADLILGATSGGATLDVGALPAGTLVIDDSFPRAFDEGAALARMRGPGDALLLGGGMVAVGPLERRSPFPQADAIRARYPSRWLPGCHAEALLLAREPGLGPTVGVVGEARALAVRAAVLRAGWCAPPLHLGTWELPEDLIAGFKAQERPTQ